MNMNPIHFCDAPGFPNLFLDYLYEFENVAAFYPKNFKDIEKYPAHFRQVVSRERAFSDELSDIIAAQYGRDYFSDKTAENLQLLKSENTIAIVTGQQLGILGGPLYTIYKTITAIKLAQKLSEQYPEFHFVPVFWLEADDHDYEEVRHLQLINAANELQRISYPIEETFDEEKGTVGNLVFTEAINGFFEELKTSLRGTEFTEPMIEMLSGMYAEGKTFKDAFRELIFSMFDAYGLIIFDPQDIAIKKLLSPVFRNEVANYLAHAEKLVARSATLEETYHAQVKIRPLNLFYHIDKGRFAIDPDEEGGFRLRKKRVNFNHEELLQLTEQHPERFSPNVILRPICQDYLFPTGFYIAGPAEVSYFAQIMPLYEMFNIPEPVIYPRASVTLLEKSTKSILDKYALKLQDVYLNQSTLHEKVMNSLLSVNLDDLFKQLEGDVAKLMQGLKDKLSQLDKTTADASEKYKIKLLSSLVELKSKAVESEKRKHEVVIRQLIKLADSVYPHETLQERQLNYFYFYNKYGAALLDKLFEGINVDEDKHQLIEL
jgi:bacillithiol biosynthesis cysteine-adding enzyme BshC